MSKVAPRSRLVVTRRRRSHAWEVGRARRDGPWVAMRFPDFLSHRAREFRCRFTLWHPPCTRGAAARRPHPMVLVARRV